MTPRVQWPHDGPTGRRGAPVRLVEVVGELLARLREQVPVPVARHPDRAVAEVRFDFLHVPAVGDEQRRAGVPQVVEAQRVG